MKKIVVVGSLNYDHNIQLDHLPAVGETILSDSISYAFGGKGANQAVALAKMQVAVGMIGAVGDDAVGSKMIANLQASGVATEGIIIKEQELTGFALIYLDHQGKNMIVVHPGANFKLTIEDIKAKEQLLLEADYCLLQLEIPMDVIEYVVSFCKEHEIPVVLNPAPAVPNLSKELLSKLTYLVPNETELALLSKGNVNMESVEDHARSLLELGVSNVLVTLGEHGSCLINQNDNVFVPAKKVKAIDTTAAGDSCLGWFLAGLCKGYTQQEAMELGTKVASITVTRKGAQDAIPSWDEVTKQ